MRLKLEFEHLRKAEIMKFRKILLLALGVCLLFSVAARADECEHLYRTTEYLGSSYLCVDESFHKLRESWRQSCVHCGDEASTYYEFDQDQHVFGQERDWHVEGESFHRYAESCIYCNYTRYWTEACSGANCVKQTIKWRLGK